MKIEIMEMYCKLKDFGNIYLNMNYDAFLETYDDIYFNIVILYYDNVISKCLKKYFKRKLWAIHHSYKYNKFYLYDYKYKKLLY